MRTFVVNFMPWRQRRQARLTRYWWSLLFLLIVGLLWVLLAGKYVVMRQRMAQEAALQAQQVEHQQRQTQWQAVQQAMAQLQRYTQRQRANDAAREHNLRYVRLLEQLALLTPDGLWLTALVEKKEDVIHINGMSYGYNDIVQLRARLENETALTAVQIVQARHESAASEHNSTRFTPLTFQLQATWHSESHDAVDNVANE